MSIDSSAPAVHRGSGAVPRLGALVLAGLLLLRFVAVLLGDGVSYGLFRLLGTTPQPWFTAVLAGNVHVVVLADLATLVVVAALLRREGRRLRDLLGPTGLGGTAWRALVAFVPLYLVFGFGAYLAAAVTGPAPAPASVPTIPLWFGVWSIAVLPVTVAVAEEFLYRGFLLPRLAVRIGTPAAVLVTSAAFALQHVGMAATSVPSVVGKLVPTFLAGLVLAGLVVWFRGRLLPLVIAHWALDVLGIGVPMLYFALRG